MSDICILTILLKLIINNLSTFLNRWKIKSKMEFNIEILFQKQCIIIIMLTLIKYLQHSHKKSFKIIIYTTDILRINRKN